MKKIILATLMIIVTLSSGFLSVATDVKPEEPQNYGEPIEVITYKDQEDGSITTIKTYFVPDKISTKSDSGSGWFKNESTKQWTGGEVMTYYANGYFKWDGKGVSVTNASGGNDADAKFIKVSDEKTVKGTGNYGGVFNQYAYVTYSFKTTNLAGMSNNFSIRVRISESGNSI